VLLQRLPALDKGLRALQPPSLAQHLCRAPCLPDHIRHRQELSVQRFLSLISLQGETRTAGLVESVCTGYAPLVLAGVAEREQKTWRERLEPELLAALRGAASGPEANRTPPMEIPLEGPALDHLDSLLQDRSAIDRGGGPAPIRPPRWHRRGPQPRPLLSGFLFFSQLAEAGRRAGAQNPGAKEGSSRGGEHRECLTGRLPDLKTGVPGPPSDNFLPAHTRKCTTHIVYP